MARDKTGSALQTGVRAMPAQDEESLRAAIAEAAIAGRRYLFGLCGSWDQAEDMVQEAMLKAWARRESFDGRSDVRTWLFAIVRNHWLDCLRRKKTAIPMETMTDHNPPSDPSPGPAALMARRELAGAVHAALAKLPSEQREALALRESEGLSFPQIAQVLQVPLPTVKSRVRYALLKLADELQAYREPN